MSENALKLLEEREEILRQQLRDVRREIDSKRLETVNLNYEGKFVSYVDSAGIERFMRVSWVRRDIEYTDRIQYTFRGFGFCGEFYGYQDCTWFGVDFDDEFSISGRTVEEFMKEVGKVKEITAEKFSEAFKLLWTQAEDMFSKEISELLEEKV